MRPLLGSQSAKATRRTRDALSGFPGELHMCWSICIFPSIVMMDTRCLLCTHTHHLFWACHTADEDTNSLPWAGEPVQSKLLAVRGGSWISGQWSPATLRKSMLKGLGSCCLLAGERHPGERVLLKDLVWGLGLPSSNRVTLGKSEGSRMHSWKGLWALFYKRPKIRNEAISFRSHSD